MKIPVIDPTYVSLSPDAKERYIYEVMRTVLFENLDGVSVTKLTEVLPFAKKTIEKQLDKLISLNEGFSKKYGNSIVYFPNHRAIHSSLDKDIHLGGKTFRVSHIENMLGSFIFIQEYEMGNFGKEVKGGLMVPLSKFNNFVTFLSETNSQIKRDENDEAH